MKKSVLVKVAAGVAAAGLFAFLFMRSLQDTRAAAYTVPPQHLERWTLALETASSPNDPLLVLRPTEELSANLFKQIFSRAMESLNAPVSPAIPVILRGEFDRVVGEQLRQDSLIEAARAGGVESAPVPRCIVHRHVSEPGGVRQVYFIAFDAPAIAQFRRQLGLEPDALAPVLFVGGAGAQFNSWLPQRVAPDDCLAPIEVRS